MTQRRLSIVAATLAVVATMLVALVASAPNADAASYRYWVYWLGGSGNWSFSPQGASHIPADGTVEGWRFAVSKEAGSSATPRVSSSFDKICKNTEPVDGKKRVGLVVDFGVSADAPPGETPPAGPIARCFVLPTTATGYNVLVAATSIRVVQAMVCGIAGYPKTGCGEAVSNPKPTPSPTQSSGSNNGDSNNSGGGGHHHNASSTPTPSPTPSASATESEASSKKHHHKRQDQGGNKADHPKPSSTTQPAANGDNEEQVKASQALKAGLPSDDTSNSPMGALLGLCIVVGLFGAAFWVRRRR